MSDHSSIEWTDATWNPVRGCTKISPGCAHCYAETFSERFRGVPGHPYEQGFDLRLVPEKLADPLRWKRPRMIFVNSMSDLFHEDMPDDHVHQVVRVMQTANRHTYQVLTRRSERLRDLLPAWEEKGTGGNRENGEERVVSLFPPLPPVPIGFKRTPAGQGAAHLVGRQRRESQARPAADRPSARRPGARPLEKAWVVSIRDQCQAAGVPFFFKQWGRRMPCWYRVLSTEYRVPSTEY